jgi:hypothetical protein
MGRDKSEIDCESDIDEFIQIAQRWSTLHKRLLSTLVRLPEEIYQFTAQKSRSTQAKVKPFKYKK